MSYPLLRIIQQTISFQKVEQNVPTAWPIIYQVKSKFDLASDINEQYCVYNVPAVSRVKCVTSNEDSSIKHFFYISLVGSLKVPD